MSRWLCTALGLLFVMGLASPVAAGDLFNLTMRFEDTAPSAYPVDLEVKFYKKDLKPDNLLATSSATFDGTNLSGVVCDGLICITDAQVSGGNLVISYSVAGSKSDGTFESSSKFVVCIDGTPYSSDLHTSCSQPIVLETPLPADPSGTFYVESGAGDCLESGDPGVCPSGSKLYEVEGRFLMPFAGCATPANVTFNVYEKEIAPDKLKGTATGTWNGLALGNRVCDAVACMSGAWVEDGQLKILYEASGFKGSGEFSSDTMFEVIIDGCGTSSVKFHSSCSRTILMYTDTPFDDGGGYYSITGGCGECLDLPPVAVQPATWGKIKSTYE